MGMNATMLWNTEENFSDEWYPWGSLILTMLQQMLLTDITSPSSNVIDKTVFSFHDETTFQANEDQSKPWAPKGTKVIRPKSKEAELWFQISYASKVGI